MSKNAQLLALQLTLLLLAGCGGADERTVRVATQAADRQAEQNKVMAKQNDEITAARKRLIESEAEARRHFEAMQKGLQTQQEGVLKQRDDLEVERKEIAAERLWESRLGPVLEGLGIVVVAVLVLAYCCMLAFGLRRHDSEVEVNELLVQDLMSERPMFLALPCDNGVKQLLGPTTIEEDASTLAHDGEGS